MGYVESGWSHFKLKVRNSPNFCNFNSLIQGLLLKTGKIMDFDIGNLLYVVIILVSVIIGLLGKKKKPAGENKSKPGFMENLEKMLTMGQEANTVRELADHEADLFEEEQPVFEEEAESKPSFMDEYEQILKQNEGHQSVFVLKDEEASEDELEEFICEEDEGTDYFEIIKDFDAGTAVVYSAIINRLDY